MTFDQWLTAFCGLGALVSLLPIGYQAYREFGLRDAVFIYSAYFGMAVLIVGVPFALILITVEVLT